MFSFFNAIQDIEAFLHLSTKLLYLFWSIILSISIDSLTSEISLLTLFNHRWWGLPLDRFFVESWLGHFISDFNQSTKRGQPISLVFPSKTFWCLVMCTTFRILYSPFWFRTCYEFFAENFFRKQVIYFLPLM